MAQTRTAGKAFRSAFAWIAVLAGYSATPAEEMKKEYVKDTHPKPTATEKDIRFLKETRNMVGQRKFSTEWKKQKQQNPPPRQNQ